MEQRSLNALGFKEWEHLREWLISAANALGEELLITQIELEGFDDTHLTAFMICANTSTDAGFDPVRIRYRLAGTSG